MKMPKAWHGMADVASELNAPLGWGRLVAVFVSGSGFLN
jgi:hypothetical protein